MPELHHLNKDDLFLLMESYRNMIQMHSTLLQQQKQMIELQNSLLSKEDNISLSQEKTLTKIDNMISDLSLCANNLQKTNITMIEMYNNIEKTLTGKLGGLKDDIGNNQKDITKQHTGINTKLYVAMGGSATIIIALIGLIYTLVEKFSLLTEVHKIVTTIFNYFGMGN